MDTTDELAKKTEEKRDSPVKKVSSSLTTQQIVIAGIIVAGIFYMVYMIKKLTPKQGFIIGLICIAIIFLLSEKGRTNIIPIREAKALLKAELKYMQKETKEFPQGKIDIMPHFKLKNIDYKPNRYHIGFRLTQWDELPRIFVGEVDPYEGRILAVVEMDGGFDASDIKADVEYIRLKEDVWRDTYGRHRRY